MVDYVYSLSTDVATKPYFDDAFLLALLGDYFLKFLLASLVAFHVFPMSLLEGTLEELTS